MNCVQLVGNLTKDPELKTTSGGHPFARFTVAVTRTRKGQDGKYQSDFITCVAWRQTAEFVAKYFRKGSKIGIIGSIETSTYDDASGNRHYRTEVKADNVEFVTPRDQNGSFAPSPSTPPAAETSLFAEMADGTDIEMLDGAELPF